MHLTIKNDTNRNLNKLVCLLLFEDLVNYDDCPKNAYTTYVIHFIEDKGNKPCATNSTIICIYSCYDNTYCMNLKW